jgi:hypothetical protein
MNKIAVLIIAAAGTIAVAGASAQTGPVAQACNDDAAEYCADKSHGGGELRACLEENIDKVTEACKTALETTAAARGRAWDVVISSK